MIPRHDAKGSYLTTSARCIPTSTCAVLCCAVLCCVGAVGLPARHTVMHMQPSTAACQVSCLTHRFLCCVLCCAGCVGSVGCPAWAPAPGPPHPAATAVSSHHSRQQWQCWCGWDEGSTPAGHPGEGFPLSLYSLSHSILGFFHFPHLPLLHPPLTALPHAANPDRHMHCGACRP
jgi:hypothetical protein